MRERREITIGHTLDADDAFMFYALTSEKLRSQNFEITHELRTIQELNEAALAGKYEMSALSFAAYPRVADKYALMPCGACMGFKQGPMLLSKKEIALQDLDRLTIAIPGRLTTAYLVLQMVKPGLTTVEVPFDQIVNEVSSGKVDAGLIIHEAQMTYQRSGLAKVVDLGEWWFGETGLPLPLGGNVIRRDIAPEISVELTRMFQESIRYAMANRDEAVSFAMRYARGLEVDAATKFIGTYVNEWTVDYGEEGRMALVKLFERAYEVRALDHPICAEFVNC